MKPRDQIIRSGKDGNTIFLRSQIGDVLNIGNATFVSGAGGGGCDDATVTFSQSSSQDDGHSYIKIDFGTSTSTAGAGSGRLAKYYFWDTGYKVTDYPMISLSMDCSGALETDLTAVTASTSKPAVAFGICIFSGSGVAPVLHGTTGRWNDVNPYGGTQRYTAWRMGLATDRVNWDSNEGDTDNFNFTNGSNANNGTAELCRGFRTKIQCSLFPRNTGENVLFRWISVGYNPGNNCDGNNEQVELVTTGDLPADDDAHIFIYIGAGNTATGGGPAAFAGIFKSRIL